MCGIYGTINKNIPLEKVIPHMIHRGPDAQKTWEKDNVQLHHFRLSILDISGGVQPMEYNDLVTIFNGELYNHQDVRNKFDLKCQTNSDTETLLVAYEKLGPECLQEFDGMFALAILNKKTKQLFLARDRAGKKPLYMYKNASEVVFSSELRSLSETLDLSPNHDEIDKFFKGGFLNDATAYENVHEIQGGYYAILDTNSMKYQEKQWWNIEDFYSNKSKLKYSDAKDSVSHHLNQGVKRRIESSDLEVGAFLSGGIDSGLVVAEAMEYTSKLKTFTVAMPGAYNEAPLAKLVADHFKTHHTEINISFDNLKNDFENIVSNYGEPFVDSSAIPSYYVSNAAKQYVTVVLNGDGADELFGGYRRYVLASKIDLYNPRFKGLAKMLIKGLPIAHEKKSKYNYLYRMVKTLSQEKSDAYYSVTVDFFHDHKDWFVSPGMNNEFIDSFLEKYKSWSGLDKQMALDFYILLRGLLLKKMDIATMAHSLEGRSPFLCKELLELAPSLPDGFKLKGTTTKRLLRELAKEKLPIEIFNQPKRGFEIPLKKWINSELSEIIHDYLDKDSTFVSRYIKQEYISKLLKSDVNISEEKRAKMIYQLLVTEIWARKNNFS